MYAHILYSFFVLQANERAEGANAALVSQILRMVICWIICETELCLCCRQLDLCEELHAFSLIVLCFASGSGNDKLRILIYLCCMFQDSSSELICKFGGEK